MSHEPSAHQATHMEPEKLLHPKKEQRMDQSAFIVTEFKLHSRTERHISFKCQIMFSLLHKCCNINLNSTAEVLSFPPEPSQEETELLNTN